MNLKTLIFAGTVYFMATASCTSDNNDARNRHGEPADKSAETGTSAPINDITIVRGHYVFGHEVRSFRPCGEDETLWVVDGTDLLRDLHTELAPKTTPYAEIFVVAAGRIGPSPADGFGADYPGALSIEKVIYAAFEGFGCDFDWGNFTYRAQGNEPFWMVDVLPSEMRFARPGHDDQTWTHVRKDQTDDAVIFHAIGEDRSTIQLVIETGPSRDTMSGAYYGLSARLILDGKTFTGSALQGSGATSE
jgi:uncharacterized membrane protein